MISLDFQFQDDVFFLLPAVVIGRVGDDAEPGIAVGWLFWIVAVYAA